MLERNNLWQEIDENGVKRFRIIFPRLKKRNKEANTVQMLKKIEVPNGFCKYGCCVFTV